MAIILCVPTPLNKNREPDLTYVRNTLNSLKSFLRKGQLLSLESTTYPGTTEEVLKPIIESLGFEIGHDFFLIYSPEREDPGNKKYSTSSIPKIIGGITPTCREIGIELYSKIIEIKKKNNMGNFFTKNLFTKFLLLKFAPNQLHED